MFIAHIRRRIKREVETVPRWLRWLENAAPVAHEEYRRARKAFFVYTLPCGFAVLVLIAASKNFEFPESSYPRVWFALLWFAVMLWPASLARLGIAAYRGIPTSAPRFATRLRVLAACCFSLATVCSLILVGLSWLAFAAAGSQR
jgi:hypothetical protein